MALPGAPRDRARQTLRLLPRLSRWASARVQEAQAGTGLSLRQYATLHAIREGATSPGELARRWQVTPAVITGIIDRLEGRGLVRREPDPTDRRRQRLVLTEAGLAASRALERELTDDLATQLGTASAIELDGLGRALDLLERALAELLEDRAPTPYADEDGADWNGSDGDLDEDRASALWGRQGAEAANDPVLPPMSAGVAR